MTKSNVVVNDIVKGHTPKLIYGNRGETYFLCDVSIFPPDGNGFTYHLVVINRDDEEDFLNGGEICDCYDNTSYTGTLLASSDIAEYSRILVGPNDALYLTLDKESSTKEIHYNLTGDRVTDDRVSKSGTLYNGPIFTEVDNEIFRQAVGMSSYATVIMDVFSLKDNKDVAPLEIYVSKYDDPASEDLYVRIVPGKFNYNSIGLHRKYNLGYGSKYNIMRITIPVLKQHERIIARTDSGAAYFIAARGIVKKSLEEGENGN